MKGEESQTVNQERISLRKGNNWRYYLRERVMDEAGPKNLDARRTSGRPA